MQGIPLKVFGASIGASVSAKTLEAMTQQLCALVNFSHIGICSHAHTTSSTSQRTHASSPTPPRPISHDEHLQHHARVGRTRMRACCRPYQHCCGCAAYCSDRHWRRSDSCRRSRQPSAADPSGGERWYLAKRSSSSSSESSQPGGSSQHSGSSNARDDATATAAATSDARSSCSGSATSEWDCAGVYSDTIAHSDAARERHPAGAREPVARDVEHVRRCEWRRLAVVERGQRHPSE